MISDEELERLDAACKGGWETLDDFMGECDLLVPKMILEIRRLKSEIEKLKDKETP